MTRWLSGGILGCCVVVVAIGWSRPESSLADTDSVLFWFSIPLVCAISVAAFWASAPQVRLALGTFLLLMGLAEAVAGMLRAHSLPAEATWVEPEYYQADPVLGWAPKASIETRAWKRVSDVPVYDVRYTIDEFARRETQPTAAEGRGRFLVLAGGSFAFGEGLEDDETLAHYVGDRAPAIHPYNYGFHGYGPQHLLARLEATDLRPELAESDGILVYLFIDAHIIRTVGSMIVYSGWADEAPYYALGPEGELRRNGNFTTGRPLRAILYSLLGRSRLLKQLEIDLPLRIADRHVDLTARVLSESQRRFHEQFELGRFVVAVFPGSVHAERISAALDRYGVPVLDYSRLFDYDDPAYYIAEDWHPSARANQRLAQQLVGDLGLAEGATP